MKTYTQNILQVLFICGVIGFFALWQRSSNAWDFIVYTQQWPEAACVDINDTTSSHHHICTMTRNIQTWTIHGIWPSRFDGDGPFYCDNSYPFQESEITNLENIMDNKWPNLIIGTAKTSFWKHEWTKHGTCALNLLDLDCEHKYFKMGLDLNKRFDYKHILEVRNITPSETRYKLADMREAIESFTKSKINMQCIFAKDKSEQAIIQVEVCLDKKFNTIDCKTRYKAIGILPSWDDIPYNPVFESCSENLPTQYLPFRYVN
ncbi:ribonuclease Oy-like [Clavelina lepadiformis]|uniref:ribonuclease Oy-like n=1 Tax=Clavelina lepadiformis TaxID=159417 RepID=UPI0040420A16